MHQQEASNLAAPSPQGLKRYEGILLTRTISKGTLFEHQPDADEDAPSRGTGSWLVNNSAMCGAAPCAPLVAFECISLGSPSFLPPTEDIVDNLNPVAAEPAAERLLPAAPALCLLDAERLLFETSTNGDKCNNWLLRQRQLQQQ